MDGILGVNFRQDGGDLDGTFDITETFFWDDGRWSADSTSASTTISSTGTLEMDDTTHYYSNRDIINNGTVNWTGGTMLTNSEGSFVNNGTFNDLSNDNHNISESSGNSTFTNNGTYLKTGTGTTRIDQTFDSSSPKTLDVRNGVLELNGGGTNHYSGAVVVKHTGLIRFTDNYTIQDAANLTVDSLVGDHGYELEDGDLDLNGTLNVNFLQTGGVLEGTQTIESTFDWNGGYWDSDSDGASTTIGSTGTLNINADEAGLRQSRHHK